MILNFGKVSLRTNSNFSEFKNKKPKPFGLGAVAKKTASLKSDFILVLAKMKYLLILKNFRLLKIYQHCERTRDLR